MHFFVSLTRHYWESLRLPPCSSGGRSWAIIGLHCFVVACSNDLSSTGESVLLENSAATISLITARPNGG